MNEIINFSLRMPEDLHKELTIEAKNNYRSLNSEILHQLKKRKNKKGGE
jgi:predicted HicB family RNase H-like nuclease